MAQCFFSQHLALIGVKLTLDLVLEMVNMTKTQKPAPVYRARPMENDASLHEASKNIMFYGRGPFNEKFLKPHVSQYA